MNLNYCIACSELHEGGYASCPKVLNDYAIRYTDSKSWSTDLKEKDLPAKGGYPEDPGHIHPKHISSEAILPDGRVITVQDKIRAVAEFDNGEPNCKVHGMSLIFSSTKGGGSGSTPPIDRETASIRQKDEKRLIEMYKFIMNPNMLTGIPTVDRERRKAE